MPSPALCPQCRAENPDTSESCFRCGRALFALVQGSVLSQRYEIERPLGQGGMGRVYQARDCILDETVAIKVLRPELTRDRELAARFRSEIKLARRVTHRNVCRIHEYGEDGRQRFISMEYIDGLNLRDYLRGRAVGAEEAFELSLQMGRGLEAVHELGILHRDFKAANIMVDSRGVVKLMDFGIAKQIEAGPQGITTTGHVMGTPEYMSPEQARGGQVDLRSDLYALGCVIYEAFTGQGLFQGDSAASVLYKHLHEPPPLETTPGLPGPLMPVLARALAKAPSERYRHAAELLEALESARAAAGFRDPGQRAILLPLPVPPQLPGLGVSPATTPLPWPIPPAPAPGALAAPTRFLPRRPAVPGSARAVLALMVVAVVGLGYTFWPLPRWTDPAHAPRPMERTSPSPVPQEPPPALAAPEEPSPPQPGPEAARGTPAPAPRPTPAAAAAHRAPASPSPLVASATPAPVHAAEAEPAPRPPLPTPSPVPDAATGTLSLLVVPPAEVTVGALELGLVSSRELALAPGRHAVRVQHPDYEPLQRVVRIRAGETERLVLDLAEKGIPREQR